MKLFWNTFNGMFIGTIVIIAIVAFICAVIATNMTFKHKRKESFMAEFFGFIWSSVLWLAGLSLGAIVCIFFVWCNNYGFYLRNS